MTIRLEIYHKFHTTIFLDQKLYTLKTRKSGLFSLTINQRKCINISNLVFFVLKFQQFQKKGTLGVREITKYTGIFLYFPRNIQKIALFS